MVYILFLQLGAGAGIKKKFMPQQNAIFQLLILQHINEECRETMVSSPNGPLVVTKANGKKRASTLSHDLVVLPQ